jgi:hypothetical protein
MKRSYPEICSVVIALEGFDATRIKLPELVSAAGPRCGRNFDLQV